MVIKYALVSVTYIYYIVNKTYSLYKNHNNLVSEGQYFDRCSVLASGMQNIDLRDKLKSRILHYFASEFQPIMNSIKPSEIIILCFLI